MRHSDNNRLITARAAAVLGVSPQNLRRWIREGKFSTLPPLEWDNAPGFQRQRTYPRAWIDAAAIVLGVTPNWDLAPE